MAKQTQITVKNFDKNGNLIPDMGQVVLDLNEWHVVASEFQRLAQIKQTKGERK